jgi:hypothetical protein
VVSAWVETGLPHLLQNFTPGFRGLPQWAQKRFNGLPQFSQNSASGSLINPQLEHFTFL